MSAEKMLFVIGNGFDLYHRLDSSYLKFREFLIKRPSKWLAQFFDGHFSALDLPEEYTKIHEGLDGCKDHFERGKKIAANYEKIPSINTWNFFEAALGCLGSVDVDDTKKMVEFSTLIKTEFCEWLKKDVSKMVKLITPNLSLPKDALYLNFNYTPVLEDCYSIPRKNVNHIHGEIGGCVEVGHADYQSLDDTLQPCSVPSVDPSLLANIPDLQEKLAFQAEKIDSTGDLHSYYKNTLKDVKTLLAKNELFWQSLQDISCVYVLGHSLGFVDFIYFKRMKEMLPSAKWIISYYDDDAKSDIESRQVFKELLADSSELKNWDEIKQSLDDFAISGSDKS